MSSLKILRTKETYRNKISTKKAGTILGIFKSIDNFENYCMEKHGKANIIQDLKEADQETMYDVLQDWVNWNEPRAASTVRIHFSNVKKYLHYMGIKLFKEDIDNEIDFKSSINEELHGLSITDIQTLFKELNYKYRTLFSCQLSGLHRIGEIVQLKKKHLILDHDNIIVKIPAYMAKFNKGRTTFWSKEASRMVRPLLKKIDDDDLIFAKNENVQNAENVVEQQLRRALVKSHLDMRYESTGRFMINTHSFRAYGITKISRHDENFAKKIAGQKGYLLQYDRIDDEEKLELYQKYEQDLLIDKDVIQKAEIENLKTEKDSVVVELEKKVKKLEAKKGKTEIEKMLNDVKPSELKKLLAMVK